MTDANGTSLFSMLPILFSLHQGKKILVLNSDNYTLPAINREAAGEYKCTLKDNEKLEASQSIVVGCEYSWHMQWLSILNHNTAVFQLKSSNCCPGFRLSQQMATSLKLAHVLFTSIEIYYKKFPFTVNKVMQAE